MRAMRRQMLYVVVIIVAFIIFRLIHHSGPMQLPSDAIVQGNTVKVPLSVAQTEQQAQQNWSVYERSDKRWVVEIHQNGQTTSFLSQGTLQDQNGATSKTGTDYATGGKITFDGAQYIAQVIHLNATQTKGYILFRSLGAPATGNLTAPSAANNTSNNS